MSKLEDFGGMQEIADEYSDVKTCSKSDVGYHCSCYDEEAGECHICGEFSEASINRWKQINDAQENRSIKEQRNT